MLTSCTQDDEPGGNILPEGKYPLQISGITLGAEVSEQLLECRCPADTSVGKQGSEQQRMAGW